MRSPKSSQAPAANVAEETKTAVIVSASTAMMNLAFRDVSSIDYLPKVVSGTIHYPGDCAACRQLSP
jgi:hypothetical protein